MTIYKSIGISLAIVASALFSAALPALAQTGTTTVSSGQKIACVASAISAREQAIDSAQVSFSSTVNSAYSARAAALQSAYQQTNASAIRPAVKTAWSTFNTSVKSARKTWQTARNSAWSTFRSKVNSCKAQSLGVSDEGNSAAEVSGN